MVTTASFEHLTDGLARITPVLIDGTLKGSAVLAVAWLAASTMRRSSSAARHMVWFAALLSLLALPLLGRALPAWRILPGSWDVGKAAVVQRTVEDPQVEPSPELPLPPSDAVAMPSSELKPPARPLAPTAAAPAAKPLSIWAWIGLVWLAGAGLLGLRLLVGMASLLWASWRLQACTDEGWRSALLQVCSDLGVGRRVRMLQGHENAMPMTWGLFVPHLLVPARAGDWTPSRRRVVLLHELAHVKRWDCLTQLLAEVACAAQWFNPLVWIASKRMQNEAERACDDLVIARGSQPGEYAEHLLQIAASQHQGYLAAAMAAIPMARTSKLEGRLLAILDGQRSRRAMTLGAFALAVALVAGVVVPVAMLRAANKPAEADKATSPTTVPGGQAIARLPGGLTVEVAGVSYHPSQGREWWGPNGTVGEQYAFVTPKNSVSGPKQGREFVVRLKGEGATEAGFRWHIEPSISIASGPAKPVKGVREGVVQYLATSLPAGDKTATIRVDVASGPWMTLAEETAGPGMIARGGGTRKGPTIFSPAYESDGGAGISVSHNMLEGQVRIVAIDKDGQEHTTPQVGSGSADGIVQTTAHFTKLPLKDVKSFRLEGRGYLWVTFRNVSLEPGYKTDVQVEIGPVAYVPDEVSKQKAAESRMGGVYATVVKAPGTAKRAPTSVPATQPDTGTSGHSDTKKPRWEFVADRAPGGFVDLDGGRTMAVPPEVKALSPEAVVEWGRTQGFELQCTYDKHGRFGVKTLGLAIVGVGRKPPVEKPYGALLEALNGDSRGDDFIPYVPNETHWQVYKTHRGSLGVFCIAGGLSGPGLRNFAPAMQDPQGLRVTWVSYTPPEGEYPPSPAMPADVTPEVAKARQLAKRSISANNIGMFLRGLHICMAQRDGRSPDDQPWPEDLRQIVEKGLRKAYDESADYLTNPERPGMRPAYVYVKPEVPLSRIHNPGREVAIYEAFDDWGGGINVGFLDGHVTFMDSEEEFRKLLNREHQKRMERYMNLGAPSSAPAAAVPTPVPAPSAQPEGEFYVLGTVRSGVFSLTGRKISLLQGLAAGGGLRPGSKTVSLLRPDGQGHTETVVTLSVETMPWKDSPLLQPGDVIYVGGEPLGAADTLTEAKAKLEALKAQYEAYRKTPLDLIPLTPEILAAVEADPQIAELKERRTRLIEARRALVERFGQQHRTVSDYDKRIDAADKEIKARRSEKANEYRRALIERVRLDMLAATAAVEQLERSGSGTGTN